MDQIISKLSEIEVASVRIIDGAAIDTKELDRQLKENIASYDKAEDQKMADTLSRLKEEYSMQLEKELNDLKQQTDTAIHGVTAAFEQQHTQLAEEILQNLIRM